jgi:hypothetical protein
MAAINFPNSPSVNQVHTESGLSWVWNGTTWDIVEPAARSFVKIVDQDNVEYTERPKLKFIGHSVADDAINSRVVVTRQQESQYRFEIVTVLDQDIWTSAATITKVVKSLGANTVEYKINAGSYIALTFTSGVWTGSISVAANDVLSWRITYNAGYTNCSFNVIHNRV